MRRFDRLERILALDPDRDCEEIYRLLAEYEFPWDITKALEFALFRTYAVPSIGRLLDRTGEFTRRPQRRYDDTVLILFEIFHWGVGSDRGRRALEQLNAIHGRFRISKDDYRYTLSTFVVTPVRWIDRFGWRRLHPREVRALTNTMRLLGQGMRISAIPETYAEFERLFDDYEREHFGFDPGGRRVAEATLRLFGSWYPRLLSPAVAHAARLLMEPHLLAAFGFPQVGEAGRRAAELALRLRAHLVRVGPARPDSRPVAPTPLSYPNGYEIEKLGPDSFHRHQC
ncbi:peptidase [Saccharopolyspora subtropica]|uniref:Oxygenase MpaB family protein n=1 Tax=Saccharopolyspora thermophila TaxID=89367 RepID=A0A917JWR8_9PSEU|nr:oxygenase MpaB family protein [Saccharopolyspora subtropica]GGI86433.1 peptidase [Saccharopolyspora subtropica]